MKLSKSKNIASLFNLKAIVSERANNEMPYCVQPLLQQFALIFQEPSTLPPDMDNDYQFHLKSDVDPIHVRPYRFPHFQKSEMEKLVQEILQ